MSDDARGQETDPPAAGPADGAAAGGAHRSGTLVRGVQMLAPDGRVTGADSAEAFAFHTDGEVAGGLPERLLAVARADGQASATLWRERPDGSRFQLEILVRALRGPGGDVVGFARIASETASPRPASGGGQQTRSLTPRRGADVERERLAQMLEQATKAAGIDIWEWTVSPGDFLWENSAVNIFGEHAGAAPPSGASEWFARIHPADRDRVARQVRDAVAGSTAYDTEFRFVMPDGAIRQYRAAATAIADDAGPAIRLIGASWDITRQKNAEAAQARVLERMTLAIEAGQFGVWEVDLATGERFWDRRTREMYGVDPDGASPDYEKWLLTLHPDDRDRMRAAVGELVEAATSQANDFRLFWPNGEMRHLRGLANLVRDSSGAPQRAVGILADLTTSRIAETERAQLTDRMKLALDAGKMGIWEVDLRSGAVNWDDRMLDLYQPEPGSDLATLAGWLKRIHPSDRRRVQRAVENSLGGNFPGTQEFRVVRRDGSTRHIHSEMTTVRDAAGTPVRLVGLSMDITERRMAELELARLTDRITLALRAGQLGVWEVNAATGEARWDQTVLAHYGLDPAAPTIAEDWTTRIHPDDRDRVTAVIGATLNSSSATETEFRVVWPDGAIRTLRVLAMAIRDSANPRIVGISQDVTEARTMALRLEEEKQRLLQTVEQWTAAKQANRAKSEFLTTMSHELRTPLNAILGFGQLLTMERFGPLNERQAEYVGAILESGTHLRALIDEILELSTIEAGKMEVTIGRVELASVLKSVVATLSPEAGRRGVEIVAGDYGAAAPAVRADRTRLAQALLNLGSNAIKYNRAGGTVTFACEPIAQDRLRIAVVDTGIGIPPARHGELFLPFNRLGAAQTAIEGTGVGLALTRRLVDLMGGQVDFTSAPGEGSRFWIDLPIDQTAGEGGAA